MQPWVKVNKFLRALKYCYENNRDKSLCEKCIAFKDKLLCKAIPLDRTTMKDIMNYIRGDE